MAEMKIHVNDVSIPGFVSTVMVVQIFLTFLENTHINSVSRWKSSWCALSICNQLLPNSQCMLLFIRKGEVRIMVPKLHRSRQSLSQGGAHPLCYN
jgi:hypothetical protein